MPAAFDEPRLSLHPLHRLWRRLPQDARRHLLTQATALLAPHPDQPAPPARAGIAVAGELDRASGLGEGARLMLHGLDALGIPAWPMRRGRLLPPEGAPLVLHVNAPQVPFALLRLGRAAMRGRRIVGYWAWELPVAPASWRAGLAFVHEIWAPSRFTAAALEPLLPGRVRVVPHPVAVHPPAPSALGRVDFGLPADAVVTLVAFNLGSSFERKNPLGAIAAHRMAFGDRADRVLLLRVGNPHHFPADFARLRAAADRPNIRIDTRTLPAADNHALIAACDIVLSLHRSEGFGLVPAEAMLLGIPVVATDWSGNTDFMDAGCAAMVPVRLVPAHDPRGVFMAPGAMWAEPDVAAAAAHLVRLADDPVARRALGRAGQVAAQARLGPGPLAAAARALGLAVVPSPTSPASCPIS
jgi:glycosyltransferase involved in cell wall biosynthesis